MRSPWTRAKPIGSQLVTALDEAKGNRSEAARLLRIGRATLHGKLKKYRLAAGDDHDAG
ncbi:MAG: hypothetical protein IT380_17735 [Myxococcales bacterium]|nr:hypothetical protein [Myxococcales bacterium]